MKYHLQEPAVEEELEKSSSKKVSRTAEQKRRDSIYLRMGQSPPGTPEIQFEDALWSPMQVSAASSDCEDIAETETLAAPIAEKETLAAPSKKTKVPAKSSASASSAKTVQYFCGEVCALVRLSTNGKVIAEMKKGDDGFAHALWPGDTTWVKTEVANLHLIPLPVIVMKRPATKNKELLKKPASSRPSKKTKKSEQEEGECEMPQEDDEEEWPEDEKEEEEAKEEEEPAVPPPPPPAAPAAEEGPDETMLAENMRMTKGTKQSYILYKVRSRKPVLVVAVSQRQSADHAGVADAIYAKLKEKGRFTKEDAVTIRKSLLAKDS